jgi:hypothetical protein
LITQERDRAMNVLLFSFLSTVLGRAPIIQSADEQRWLAKRDEDRGVEMSREAAMVVAETMFGWWLLMITPAVLVALLFLFACCIYKKCAASNRRPNVYD